MKLLVFENSKEIAQRLIELISETIQDITFYQAGSYAEALYFLNECNPNAVLLDFEYPGDSSLKLATKIKTSENKIMVLGLLSQVNSSSVKKCEQYGADLIFDKYADFEQIPEALLQSVNNSI